MICMESREVEGIARDCIECVFQMPFYIPDFAVDARVAHLFPQIIILDNGQMCVRLNQIDIF